MARSEREEKLSPEFRAKRDEIVQKLAALRARKPQLDKAAHFAELKTLLLEETRLYQAK